MDPLFLGFAYDRLELTDGGDKQGLDAQDIRFGDGDRRRVMKVQQS
jgi:hypothetical protein